LGNVPLDLPALLNQQQGVDTPVNPSDDLGSMSNALKSFQIAQALTAAQQEVQPDASSLPAPEQGQSFTDYIEQNQGDLGDIPAPTLNAFDANRVGNNELTSNNLLEALMGRVAFDKSGGLEAGVRDPLAMRNYGKYSEWVGEQNFATPEMQDTTPYPGGDHYQPHVESAEENAQNEKMMEDLRAMRDIVAGFNPNVGPAQVYSSYTETNKGATGAERYLRDYEPETTQALTDPSAMPAYVAERLSSIVPETEMPDYSSEVSLGLSGSGKGRSGFGQQDSTDDTAYKMVNAAIELNNRYKQQQAAQAAMQAAAANKIASTAQGVANVGKATKAVSTVSNIGAAAAAARKLAELAKRFQ
jgi:hypothetical protein